MNRIPETGFIKLNKIIGDENNPPIIPVGRSTWLQGVKSGIYPKPTRLGKRIVAWNVEDINDLVNRLKNS